MIEQTVDFYCVRAFSSEEFFGNPAAVFFVEEFPKDAQDISAKINFSETVFVKPYKKNIFFIRWFSPKDEAPLCMHATIAAVYMINKKYGLSQVRLIHKRGVIDASVDANDQVHLLTPVISLKPLSSNYDVSLPNAKEILTDGLIDIVVLEGESDVLHYQPDFDAIKKLKKRALCITASSQKYDYVCRYFAPSVGIFEDPFCGSVNCRLALYWSNVLKKKSVSSYQKSGTCECIIHTSGIVEFIARADLYEERKLMTA
ncbi:MAG: PhzF family phenazine biosynthesis protein [Alphaproteobacteria bacterium]|nr:MAG: PhzF family phenazine biosynthesis protein [Alphaproteobacteria bacterium]